MKKIYVTYSQTFYRARKIEIEDKDYEKLCNRNTNGYYDALDDIKQELGCVAPSEKYDDGDLDIDYIYDDDSDEILYEGA